MSTCVHGSATGERTDWVVDDGLAVRRDSLDDRVVIVRQETCCETNDGKTNDPLCKIQVSDTAQTSMRDAGAVSDSGTSQVVLAPFNMTNAVPSKTGRDQRVKRTDKTHSSSA